MAGDDLLSQLQQASDNARTLLYDVFSGNYPAEEAIVGVLRDGLDQANKVLGSNMTFPGLSKAAPPPPAVVGTGDRLYSWIFRNRGKTVLVASVLIACVVAGGLAVLRARARRSSGKALRTKHGARKEVVVLIGNSGYTPMLRSIALDLEVRGFITYVVASSEERTIAVQKEGRMDIRPLRLDIRDFAGLEASIWQFHDLLTSKHQAFSQGPRHQLELTGIVIAREVSGTMKRVDCIAPAAWHEFLSTQLSSTFTTIAAFLPLVIEHQARIVMLTPTQGASLLSSHSSMEATAIGALNAYIQSLRKELSPSGVKVAHVQLGAIDFGGVHGPQTQRPRVGTSSVQLHNAVFDALTMRGSVRLQRVGSAASLYGAIGDYAPVSLIDWWTRRQTAPSSSLSVRALS